MRCCGPDPRLLARAAQAVFLTALGLLAGGCDSRPRAPALRDDPVYQNDREGIRFLVPEGWTQSARMDAAPGRANKELTLVDYRRKGARGASFLVSMIDLPPSTDLAAHLAEGSYGVAKWKQASPPEEVAAGGTTGTRYAFTGRAGSEERAKEVVAVRRGERVYLFTSLYSPKDKETRDQLRRVVESVIWKR